MEVFVELEKLGVITNARDVAMDEEQEELAVVTKARDIAGGQRIVITKARDVVKVACLEEQVASLGRELEKARRVEAEQKECMARVRKVQEALEVVYAGEAGLAADERQGHQVARLLPAGPVQLPEV